MKVVSRRQPGWCSHRTLDPSSYSISSSLLEPMRPIAGWPVRSISTLILYQADKQQEKNYTELTSHRVAQRGLSATRERGRELEQRSSSFRPDGRLNRDSLVLRLLHKAFP